MEEIKPTRKENYEIQSKQLEIFWKNIEKTEWDEDISDDGIRKKTARRIKESKLLITGYCAGFGAFETPEELTLKEELKQEIVLAKKEIEQLKIYRTHLKHLKKEIKELNLFNHELKYQIENSYLDIFDIFMSNDVDRKIDEFRNIFLQKEERLTQDHKKQSRNITKQIGEVKMICYKNLEFILKLRGETKPTRKANTLMYINNLPVNPYNKHDYFIGENKKYLQLNIMIKQDKDNKEYFEEIDTSSFVV